MNRWLKVMIAGLVLSIALATGAAAAVLAATSGSGEDRSPVPARSLVGESEEGPWLGVIVSGFGDEGVIVQQVFADSPAHEAGIKRGDIITAIGGKDIHGVGELVKSLKDSRPGDQVALTLLRDDQEMTLQVTLGERPEPLPLPTPKGPFAELGELEFGDILGGQFRVKDDEGDTVVIEVVAGEVASMSDDALVLNANDGSERTFAISDDTVMPHRPQEGDPVVVVTVGDSDEARVVLPARAFRLLDMLRHLRERIHERLGPPDTPRPFQGRGFEPMPGHRFHLWPQWGLELMPVLPDGDCFWSWDKEGGEY
ncbi:MAG: S1C family serine protease [Dehalococcoidia bacterium]